MDYPASHRLIFVDDDNTLRTALSRYLRLKGFEVEDFDNGKDALKALERGPAALLITDLFMPDVEGLEIIQVAKKLRNDIRVLAFSGGGIQEYDTILRMARLLGADQVLAKPCTPSELESVVRTLVEPLPAPREQHP